MELTADKIKSIRIEKKLTQKELGDFCKLAQSTISGIEKGFRVRQCVVDKINHYLGTDFILPIYAEGTKSLHQYYKTKKRPKKRYTHNGNGLVTEQQAYGNLMNAIIFMAMDDYVNGNVKSRNEIEKFFNIVLSNGKSEMMMKQLRKEVNEL